MRAISDAFFQIETLSDIVAATAVLAGVFILLLSFRRAFGRQIRGLKPAIPGASGSLRASRWTASDTFSSCAATMSTISS